MSAGMGGASKFLMLLTTSASSNIRFLSPLLPFSSLSNALPLARSHSRYHLPRVYAVKNRHFSLRASRYRLGFSVKASENLHTQTSARDDFGEVLGISQGSRVSHHPWPEWDRFLDHLRTGGYLDREVPKTVHEDDAFSGFEQLSEEFVRAANACLMFARDRSNLLRFLSRKDIEVVVGNGSPFLFKNTMNSTRRMRNFLVNDGENVLDYDRANTVDVMRFLLSYASDPLSASDQYNLQNRDFIETSVRNLLNQLVDVSGTVRESISESVPRQFLGRHEQSLPRPPGKNTEMKRGDWICPKCSFMNFAKNIKCLECSEARPKRVLTGGEWECPQCDFFNYGRNTVCLRCDCKRPGGPNFSSAPNSGSGYNPRPNIGHASDGGTASKSEIESRLAVNDEKAERWFSKVSQLNDVSDLSSTIADEDFPEIMPLRKGVNRFVVSTRKTPLERRLANAQYRRNLGNGGSPEGNYPGDVDGMGSDKTEKTISQSLDKILGHPESDKSLAEENNDQPAAGEKITGTDQKPSPSDNWFSTVSKLHDIKDLPSAIPDDDFPEIMPMRKGENRFVVSKRKTPAERRLTSPQYRRGLANQGNDSDYVPFTPLPADMFGKSNKTVNENADSDPRNAEDLSGTVFVNSETVKPGVSGLPEKPENETEKKSDGEPSDASERWFKKVAELHDVTDLASAISDEDFPEIMPMRKGENRFVISKKKDRSLTSPQYKRRLAMEQANGSNFVPFVPFPPDYFAKKDNKPAGEALAQEAPADASSVSAKPENPSGSPVNNEESRVDAVYGVAGNPNQQPKNIQSNRENWNREFPRKSSEDDKVNASYGVAAGNPTQRPEGLQNNRESGNRGFLGENLEQTKVEAQNNRQSWNTGFTGKSLEGSAVKEPDPLDMSEEAKAERWFRRVAQIKDISELSQIPDEDFPEIMPMRKGVNRFVVSKRKTPLERRLTSPQYRRNLPIISSDPEKDAS